MGTSVGREKKGAEWQWNRIAAEWPGALSPWAFGCEWDDVSLWDGEP